MLDSDPSLKYKYYKKALDIMVENRAHVMDMIEKGVVSPNIVSF